MTILRHVFFLLFAGIAIWLAVANRAGTPFSLSPLPFQIEAPLYVLLFLALFAGMGIGSLATWQASLRKRKRVRKKGPLPAPEQGTKPRLEPTLVEAEPAKEQKVLS